MNKSHHFARRSSLPAAAIAAEVCPSLRASAAPLDQLQMGADTALGRRWGLCRLALDVAQDRSLTRAGFIRRSNCRGRNAPALFSIHFIRSGRHANAAVANTETSGNCRFQRFRQGHPSHSISPSSVASEPSDGVVGSDQKAIGVFQYVDC